MKKCKNCKNPLPETADHCPNCGLQQPMPKQKKKKGKVEEEVRSTVDLGTYYNDISPEDAEELKNRTADNSLILKFVLLGFGVAIVLAACITLLILFGGEI